MVSSSTFLLCLLTAHLFDHEIAPLIQVPAYMHLNKTLESKQEKTKPKSHHAWAWRLAAALLKTAEVNFCNRSIKGLCFNL